jgi:hypothetical protein
MNLFSITSLIIFVSSIGFGLSLYSGDRTLKINREWFLFSFFIGLWSLGLFGVTWSNTAQAALIWQYLLDVSAIFVPVLYFSFASELVGLKNKIWQMFSYLLALLLAIFSFTPYFKTGMSIRYGSFYWIDPGSLYIIFPIFFLAYIIVCLVIYIRAYRKSTDRLFRSQMINMFLASAVGFGGGITNFLPQILNIYPFGNFLVLLYLFFMSYGVLKYKFISKKIVSAQLLVGAIVLVFFFNFLQMLQTGSTATQESIWIGLLLLVLVSIFGVLVVLGVYREVAQREKIELLAKDLKSANKSLSELDKHLSDKVAEQTADVRRAYEVEKKARVELEKLNSAKDNFIASTQHHLRTPLTELKWNLESIRSGTCGPLSPDLIKAIDTADISVKQLSHVIENFITITETKVL